MIRCNQILQRYLNPESSGKPEMTVHDTIFRQGDKVMQIKNNYQMPWKILGYHGVVIEEGTGVFTATVESSRKLTFTTKK